MFTISIQLQTGIKSMTATGPRRALGKLREYRDFYGVEPVVSDENRTYTEAELLELIDAART